MSIDEQHVALPKLYGAPAYARPQPVVATGPRPFDPDDLPIEAVQTDEERDDRANLPAHAWAPGGAFIRIDGQSQHDGHADLDRSDRPPSAFATSPAACSAATDEATAPSAPARV